MLTVFTQCSQKARYERMVIEGIESGERHDTLFLGLSLGMRSKDFYAKCWEMNKQGLIRQGTANRTVYYEMKDELKAPVDVNFYPNFYNDSIFEMPVTFKYQAWAPWNKQYSGDTLQIELVELFENWYGGGFMKIHHETKGDAYVKIDGNRRISIFLDPKLDGTVWAVYTDMLTERKVKKTEKKEGSKKEQNNKS